MTVDMVWAVGIEPTTSRFRNERAAAAPHPEITVDDDVDVGGAGGTRLKLARLARLARLVRLVRLARFVELMGSPVRRRTPDHGVVFSPVRGMNDMARDRLSQLDLCFVVDCTSSMYPFIHSAQQQAEAILTTLASQAGADMRFAVVGYRDRGHDPVCDVVPFARADAHAIRDGLAILRAGAINNTDAAEAVFDGLVAAGELVWREGALRVLVLVGDAPPHGCGADTDAWPDRFAHDPTGYTLDTMSSSLERRGIALFALAMVPSGIPAYDQLTVDTFGKLARATGGLRRVATTPQGAMDVLQEIAKRAFGDLELDRRIFIALEEAGALAPSADATPGAPAPAPEPMMAASVAASMGVSERELKQSVERLQKRKLIDK